MESGAQVLHAAQVEAAVQDSEKPQRADDDHLDQLTNKELSQNSGSEKPASTHKDATVVVDQHAERSSSEDDDKKAKKKKDGGYGYYVVSKEHVTLDPSRLPWFYRQQRGSERIYTV